MNLQYSKGVANLIETVVIKAEDIQAPPVDQVKSSEEPSVVEKYLSDEANVVTGEADKVFFPKNEGEASAVIRWANEADTPVTVSGGGTGITGSRVPRGGVIIATDELVKARPIPGMEDKRVEHTSLVGKVSFYLDEEEGYAIVPGGVTLTDFIDVISKKNFYYPPNPTERSSTIGGNVSTNASGARSFKYGAIRPWVRRIRVILPTGELLKIKRGQHFADRDGNFEINYPDGKTARFSIPTYRMPPVKNASGLYSKDGMDLIDLFIGSEGILGMITEVELDLVKSEDELFSCIVFFPDEEKSVGFVKAARDQSRTSQSGIDAITLDYFDRFSLDFMRQTHQNIPAEAKAAVFFEQFISGDFEEAMMNWMELFEQFGVIEDWSAMTPRDREKLRLFRHSLPENVNETVRRRGVSKMGMDLAVPDEKLDELMKIYREEASEAGLDYVLFGHIGDNNLHMNFLPRDKDEMEKVRKVYVSIAKKGIEMGGTISAEHGVGKKKMPVDGREIPYLELMYDRKDLCSIVKIKQALDPGWLFNRDNVIPVNYRQLCP